MLVDSHCHLNLLDLTAYDGSLDRLINETQASGVMHMLCVGVDLKTTPDIIAITEQYPNITASVGVHPSESLEKVISMEDLMPFATHPKVVAIGETGLDYYYNKEHLDNMRDRFRLHIQLAKQLQKPLIVHSRDAREATINILQEEGAKDAGGVMHCFTETWEMAKAAMDIGFYISFSGIITFKNAKEVAEVVKQVPLERMLIETDAPYLAPVPFRGKRNEPKYVCYVAEKVAELKSLPLEKVWEVTTHNFNTLFNIK